MPVAELTLTCPLLRLTDAVGWLEGQFRDQEQTTIHGDSVQMSDRTRGMAAPYLKIIVLALAALAGAVSGCGDNSSPTAPANRAPTSQTSIPAQTVHAGETITLDLSSYFSDPDGDGLTYSAASSDAGVVSASVSGSTLAIAGLAKGTAQVTVTATDPAGLTAKQAFTAAAVPPEPDLVFTGVSPEFSTLGPGDSATFTFHIRNQGAASSGSTTIRVMRSTNPVISVRDAELSAHPFPALAPQQNHTFQVTISIDPRSAPGTIYIGPCLDPVPDESNTGNNCSGAARVTVTAHHVEKVKQT